MMGVYIKGMEMPDDGYVCLKVFANGDVMMNKVHRGALVITGIKDKVGTAVPVPPHGDLIDRRYAIATACSGRIRTLPTTEDGENWIRVEEVRESIKNAPTIIPAEESAQKEGGPDA